MDKLVRGVLKNGKIRIFVAKTTQTCNDICSRHKTTPVASAALSRLISITSVMAAMQKNGKLSVKIEGNGPLGMMIADANSDLEVRGFVENPHIDLPLKENQKLDVGGAVGNVGRIHVVKDLGLKQNFESQVELQSGEIGDDFSFYFKESEQIPSVVAVGALIDIDYSIKSSGAIVVQLMPDASEEDFLFAETFAKNLPSVSSLFAHKEDAEVVAKKLFPNLSFIETYPIKFKCSCRKERLLNSLAALSLSDLKELEAQKDKVEITCEFCNTHFYFDRDDIKKAILLNQENKLRKEAEL